MKFVEALKSRPFILVEGAIVERLRRNPAIVLDAHVAHAGLIYTALGRQILGDLYRGYLEVGRAYRLPMMTLTPTWRAGLGRLTRAGLGPPRDVNGDCVRFLSRIRDKYGDYGGHVYVGGLMGCQGDAYQPNQALSEPVAAACHRFQAHALALAGVDFLMGSTLPALSEALGMAAAMGETGTPYVLSFVVRPSGELLDGTPLHQAIARIDAAVPAPPVGYMVNCVHPRVFRAAVSCQLAQAPASADRLMGLQANTSARPPEGLDELPYLDGDSPEALCEAMIGLYTDLGIRVLGGCCGTDERYLACLAGGVSRLLPASPSSFSG